MTVGEWLPHARARLSAAGIEAASLEAQLLAAHILLADRSYVLAHPEAQFNALAGEGLLQRREQQEPLAYILGWREFYGRRFSVRPGVLIPRQETEVLVEAALSFLSARPAPASVLDLGTGSGCIAVTLALERASAQVTAADISPEALDIATQNAADLGATVRFVKSDAFQGLLGESFDLIATNPPYVGEFEHLPTEVAKFEPSQALYSGPTGLEFYDRLATEAQAHINDGGQLMMEVGYRQAADISTLFQDAGWTIKQVRSDLTGVPRVIAATLRFACALGE